MRRHGSGHELCRFVEGETRTWVLRRIVLRQALVLEHVEQRRLARIIQAKEQNFGVFVRQTCVNKGVAVGRRHTETQHSPAAKGPCERSYTPSMFRALQNQSTRNMVECEGPRLCKTLITHEERLNGAKGPAAREGVIICTRAQIQRRTEGRCITES